MTYVAYFANAGVPETGLSLTWESLKNVSDGSDFSQPSFTEVGGGWYKFTVTGDEELVGVIDGSVTLADADRYVPVYINTALDEINKAVWQYANRTLGSSA